MLYGEANERFIKNYGIKRRNRFSYNDNWASIVLRGEAWLHIENFIDDIENAVFPPKISVSLAEQITGEIGICHWERFFDRIINSTIKYRKENDNAI